MPAGEGAHASPAGALRYGLNAIPTGGRIAVLLPFARLNPSVVTRPSPHEWAGARGSVRGVGQDATGRLARSMDES